MKKQILIIVVAAIAIFAINMVPINDANCQIRPQYGLQEFQCPDGIGTYQKCIWNGQGPLCDPNASYPNYCNPID